MQSPRVVELIGVPGSGKTTVAHLLCGGLEALDLVPLILPDAGRTMARRSLVGGMIPGPPSLWGDRLAWKLFEVERLARGIWFLVSRPRFATRLLIQQFRRPTSARARNRRVLHWWVRTVGARSLMLSRRRGHEVVVLDEGLCHRVVQLFSSADEVPNAMVASEYVRSIPLPDLLVHVVAPVDVAFERVLDRGVWERLADEEPSRVRNFLSNSAMAITQLLDTADGLDTQVIEVDNSAQSPPSGDQISRLLRAAGVVA